MKIAPTILSEGSDWKLNLRLHGEGLGRTNDAEKLLIDWDNRVAKVKRTIGRGDMSVLLIRPNDTPVRPGALGRSVLADLGLRSGTRGKRVLRIEAGPEWVAGGVLAARAALADVARAL
jgi:ABC-type Fe3+-hydroxamate transport system substrate-binding protein